MYYYTVAFELIAGSKRRTKAKHSAEYMFIYLINLVT